MEFIINALSFILTIAFFAWIFYLIRKMHLKRKASKPQREANHLKKSEERKERRNIRTFHHDFILNTNISGVNQNVTKICQDKTTHQVFFPEASDPNQHFYLTEVHFSPKYVTSSYTVKGKPAKRGHHVRNTVMFGLVGAAATHDKQATQDKTYNHKHQVKTNGKIILKSTDLKHEYSAYFEGKQWDASALLGIKYNPIYEDEK